VFKRVWTYPIHHAFGAFAADGDDCFVAARHANLVSVSSETGQVRWSASIESPHGWLAFNDRSVFYLNQHAHLIAVDRKTGERRWSRMLEGTNGWLHALGTTVVVGGWRCYTDILVIDGDDGKTLWTRSARNGALHSTRIHAESSTSIVAELEDKRIRFVRLADGVGISQAPVDWDVQFTERPAGTTPTSRWSQSRRTSGHRISRPLARSFRS
jgi:outer membrane protein assembly factor BamB